MAEINQECLAGEAKSDPIFMKMITSPHVEDAKRIFSEHGVCIIPDALSKDLVADIRETLFADMDADEKAGVLYRGSPGSDFDDKNIRIADLPNKGHHFLDLLESPIAKDFLLTFLGRGALLSSFTANIPGPGAAGMGWHTDQGYVPRPWPDYLLALNILWAIDRTTFDNGATWIVRGSHLFDRGPSLHGKYDAVALEAPPGSIYVMDGRMWHRTGVNRTVDEQRTVLLAYCCRAFIRTQVSWSNSLDPAIAAQFDQPQRDLFGLGYNPANEISVWDDRIS